jgi:hypothetical protein
MVISAREAEINLRRARSGSLQEEELATPDEACVKVQRRGKMFGAAKSVTLSDTIAIKRLQEHFRESVHNIVILCE